MVTNLIDYLTSTDYGNTQDALTAWLLSSSKKKSSEGPASGRVSAGANQGLPDIKLPQVDVNLPQYDVNLPQPTIPLPQPTIPLPQPDIKLPQVNLPISGGRGIPGFTGGINPNIKLPELGLPSLPTPQLPSLDTGVDLSGYIPAVDLPNLGNYGDYGQLVEKSVPGVKYNPSTGQIKFDPSITTQVKIAEAISNLAGKSGVPLLAELGSTLSPALGTVGGGLGTVAGIVGSLPFQLAVGGVNLISNIASVLGNNPPALTPDNALGYAKTEIEKNAGNKYKWGTKLNFINDKLANKAVASGEEYVKPFTEDQLNYLGFSWNGNKIVSI